MKIVELTNEISRRLQKVYIESARLDAELIVAEAAARDRTWLLCHSDEEAAPEIEQQALKLARKRARRLPLSYVLGRKEFYGLDFFVNRDVLTPRTESEIIVSETIKKAPPNGRVLDLGTGTGALAVAVGAHRADLKMTVTDISEEALKVARLNAKNILQSNSHQISFVKSDLFDKVNGRFDVVMANLPYVPNSKRQTLLPEVKHEPAVALFGGRDGLDVYKRFFNQINGHLKPSGRVYIESDPWQHQDLIDIARSNKLKVIFEDYFIIGFGRA